MPNFASEIFDQNTPIFVKILERYVGLMISMFRNDFMARNKDIPVANDAGNNVSHARE